MKEREKLFVQAEFSSQGTESEDLLPGKRWSRAACTWQADLMRLPRVFSTGLSYILGMRDGRRQQLLDLHMFLTCSIITVGVDLLHKQGWGDSAFQTFLNGSVSLTSAGW